MSADENIGPEDVVNDPTDNPTDDTNRGGDEDNAGAPGGREWNGVMRELAEIRAENRQLKAQLEAPDDPDPEPDPLDGVEDDDLLTAAQVRKVIASQQAATRREIETAQKEFQRREALRSERAASQRHSASVEGEGLDWKTVVREGLNELSRHDIAAIRESHDPGEEAYQRCLSHVPHLRDRRLAALAGRGGGQAGANRGGSNRGGRAERDGEGPSQSEIESLLEGRSDEDLMREIELAELGGS